MVIKNSKHEDFSPFFIVGSPRSGTTLLAVLLDRHSDISIPQLGKKLPPTLSMSKQFSTGTLTLKLFGSSETAEM